MTDDMIKPAVFEKITGSRSPATAKIQAARSVFWGPSLSEMLPHTGPPAMLNIPATAYTRPADWFTK